MALSGTSKVPELWHCNWNWCPQTFFNGRDLKNHLEQEHFNDILTVQKSEWSAHLRACDGRSGGTDSFFEGLPLSLIQQANARTSISPTPPSSPLQLPSTPDPSPRRRRSHSSFADYTTQSSPMTSPVVASLPPSPALDMLVADVVKGRRGASSKPMSASPLPALLPRRLVLRPSRSPRPPSHVSAHGESVDSSGSAQEIETQLTRSPEPSPSQSQEPWPHPQPGPVSRPAYPPMHTQGPHHSQNARAPSQTPDHTSTPSFRSGTMHIGPAHADAMQVDLQEDGGAAGVYSQSGHSQLASRSQGPVGPGGESHHAAIGHGYAYGYSPYVSPLVLQTQAPYRSQSQSQ